MIPPQANCSRLKLTRPPPRARLHRALHPPVLPSILTADRPNRLHIFSSVRDPVPAAPTMFLFSPPLQPDHAGTFLSSPHRLSPTQLARRIYGTRHLSGPSQRF